MNDYRLNIDTSSFMTRAREQAKAMKATEEDPRWTDDETPDEFNAKYARIEAYTSWLNSIVPPKYRNARIKDVHPQLAMKAEKCSNAVICGSNGSGKTFLAWALAIEYKDCHPMESVYVVNAVDMLRDIRDNEGFDTTKYEEAGLLIIDEYDKLNRSGNDFVLMTEIIDKRYSWERKTIVILNKTAENPVSVLGQSVYSRLTAKGEGGLFLEVSGRDRRAS